MENPEGGASPPPPDLLGSRASPHAAAGALRSGLLAAVGAPRSAPLAGAGAPRSAPQHAAAAPSSSAVGRPAAGAFVAAGASSSTSAAAPLVAAPDLGSGQADPLDFPTLIPQAPPSTAVGGPLAAGRPQLNRRAAALGGAGQGPQQVQPPFVAAADLGDGNAGPSSSGGLGAGQGPQQVRPAAGGGVGTRQGPPTFAQLFARSPSQVEIPVSVHPPAATDSGIPAAFFSNEEVHASICPLDLAIMAKTPQGRPPFPLIRAHLAQRFNFQQDFLIAPYDGRHLLIKLGCKDDYLKMLLKATISVQDKPFWFSKWTMEFSPEADSPLVPVWLELPRLPANFYFQPMLRSIAGSIGSILQIASWTLNMTRVHAAAVCVQLDVSQPLPDRVWVGIGGGGFWQPITYPNPPRFCSECLRLGHLAHDCRNGGPPSDPHMHSKDGAPPSDPHGSKGTARGNKRAVVGNEQVRKQPVEHVIWRPTAAKPAAPKQVYPVEHAKHSAQRVFENAPQPELPSGSKQPEMQVRVQGVYLTPPKPSQHKMTPSSSANILHPVPPAQQQQQEQPPHQHQVATSQVYDGLSHSLDQLSLKEKTPGSSVRRSRGLSPHLNPAAAAWSPSVHDRGDIDLPDELPPTLPVAARNEQTQISARGKEPGLSTTQPQETDFISLQTTYDVMTFPGLPELPDDVPPKIHMRGRLPLQKGDVAHLVDKEPSEAAAQGSGEASPHTPAAGKELSADPTSKPRGRVSFATAIRKKLRASDTRRTERALEDSEEPSSGSSSEEEEPDPPPPPPKVSDWVQAAAPGKMIIGLPATQKEAEPSKLPGKDEEIPQMPARQTRQTLRRGFL